MICPEYKSAAIGALLGNPDTHFLRVVEIVVRNRSFRPLITCDKDACMHYCKATKTCSK